jgi:hypothetical protein
MRPIDVTFTSSQFKALSQYGTPGNTLSPLFDPSATTVTGRLTNREVVQSDGKLHEDIRKVLSILEAPLVMANLKCLNTKQLMDVYWYVGSEDLADGLISVSNHNGEIRLQAPSPLDEYLFLLHAMLGPEPIKYTEAKGTLDVTTAWLLWILIDEQRKGRKVTTLEEIRKRLEAKFDGLTDLGAYFCHTLELLAPSRSEIEKGLARLTAKNIMKESVKGFTLSDDLGDLALDLKVVRAHLYFALKQINSAGEVESLRYWVLQGKSGAMLLWYEVDGEVVFRVITPAIFHELIVRLLNIQSLPSAQPPEMPSTTSQTAARKVLRYEAPKPKRKSAVGRILTSFLIGLVTIAIGLFTSGYLMYTPGKGVDVITDTGTTQTADIQQSPTSATVESSTQDILVDSINIVRTTEYAVSIFGHLKNNGPSAVGMIYLDIDLLDNAGNVVQTISGWSMTDSIASGCEGYFKGDAYELTELPASANAVITYVAPAELESSVTLAEVRGMQLNTLENDTSIIADAFNTTDQSIEIVSITGVLLDAKGNLISMERSDDFDIGLRPGENMPIKVSFIITPELIVQIADSRLIIETAPVSTVIDAPLALSTEKEIFRTPNGFYFISELMNSGNEPLLIHGLVVAFYDAAGNLLDVSYSRLGLFVEPGGISPYILEEFSRLDLEENMDLQPASYLVIAPSNAAAPMETSILTLDTEVINTNQYLPDQWFLVNGNVINNNSETVTNGIVVVSLRDPATGVLKSVKLYPFYDLAPGASTGFTVYLPLPPGVDPATLTQEIRAVGTP